MVFQSMECQCIGWEDADALMSAAFNLLSSLGMLYLFSRD
uniref:Uncharacterized protein n=1 Tax=Klebsiella pneumoniae TaxID=573 RepID=A7KG75_KLEPN|nr:hypothetical protein [Klebsiella pneumoniae]